MKDPILHERKPGPSPKQWYIYFSSILIELKNIAHTLGVGRDFWQAHYLRKAIKDGGNIIVVKN